MQLEFPIMIVTDDHDPVPAADAARGAGPSALAELSDALTALGIDVVHAPGAHEATVSAMTSRIAAVIVPVLPPRDTESAAKSAAESAADVARAARIVAAIRARTEQLPIFLFGERLTARTLPTELLRHVRGCINAFEDTSEFVAKSITREAAQYLAQLAPPFFSALMSYANDGAYSWHCPGHSGGTAFLKSPTGTLFHRFFGENLLRSDVCNAVEELGQLLDHTGPIAESERRAARTFGADHLYFVTNGTSTSNKIVWNSLVGAGDIVVVDRNCHKSVLHAIILTGAIPIFLTPTRNRAGIIGPIPRSEFTPESIQAKIDAHPGITDKSRRPKVLALTQSTYDGIIYHAAEIQRTLDGYVTALHFDEAWLPHAAFHELYTDMHAISRDRPRLRDTTVYATQSTHKLLAGLSQASQVLVHEAADREFDETVFTEAFLMHTSTSPQYSIIASCDVSAAMMEGTGGHALVEEAITEALEFRRAIIRIGEELGVRGPAGARAAEDWWFDVWGPDTPAREGLADRREWELSASAPWHGFERVDEGFTMLDPIKVTVMTPGLDVHGAFGNTGIPAVVLSRYLAEHGIVVEKTGLYSFFILFTIGITTGRWNTLISELHRFKAAYDANLPVAEAMPRFAAEQPGTARTGIRDLCQAIHAEYRAHDIAALTTEIYTSPVESAMLPTEAWTAMTAGDVEHVALADLEGRITAVLLTPYPPGIPLLVPGERIHATIMRYLRFEEQFTAKFPGSPPPPPGRPPAPGGRRRPGVGGGAPACGAAPRGGAAGRATPGARPRPRYISPAPVSAALIPAIPAQAASAVPQANSWIRVRAAGTRASCAASSTRAGADITATEAAALCAPITSGASRASARATSPCEAAASAFAPVLEPVMKPLKPARNGRARTTGVPSAARAPAMACDIPAVLIRIPRRRNTAVGGATRAHMRPAPRRISRRSASRVRKITAIAQASHQAGDPSTPRTPAGTDGARRNTVWATSMPPSTTP